MMQIAAGVTRVALPARAAPEARSTRSSRSPPSCTSHSAAVARRSQSGVASTSSAARGGSLSRRIDIRVFSSPWKARSERHVGENTFPVSARAWQMRLTSLRVLRSRSVNVTMCVRRVIYVFVSSGSRVIPHAGCHLSGGDPVLLEHGDERDGMVRPAPGLSLARSPVVVVPTGLSSPESGFLNPEPASRRQLPQSTPAASAAAPPASAEPAAAESPAAAASAAPSVGFRELEKILIDVSGVYLAKVLGAPPATRRSHPPPLPPPHRASARHCVCGSSLR